MIPEKGKTYQIDYWFQTDNPELQETFYKGLAVFTGDIRVGEGSDDEDLYCFEIEDNALSMLFSEEDIVEEVIK